MVQPYYNKAVSLGLSNVEEAPHLELRGDVLALSKSGYVPQAGKNESLGSCDFLHNPEVQKGI